MKRMNLEHDICVDDGGCYGRCKIGPNVVITGPTEDQKQIYIGVSPKDCRELLESHCLKGTIVDRLAEKTPPPQKQLSPKKADN